MTQHFIFAWHSNVYRLSRYIMLLLILQLPSVIKGHYLVNIPHKKSRFYQFVLLFCYVNVLWLGYCGLVASLVASHLWDWRFKSCFCLVWVELACFPYALWASSPSPKTCFVGWLALIFYLIVLCDGLAPCPDPCLGWCPKSPGIDSSFSVTLYRISGTGNGRIVVLCH